MPSAAMQFELDIEKIEAEIEAMTGSKPTAAKARRKAGCVDLGCRNRRGQSRIRLQ